jgi:acyl carrier protein
MQNLPPVFISATSADLAKARETVRDALLDIRCYPVVQQHFPTGQGEIALKEAHTIATCKAVIHLAGVVYGMEPLPANTKQGEGAAGVVFPSPRRSYTQLEYYAAVDSKKPVYVFLATDAFYEMPQNRPDLAAPLPLEDPEKRRLQREHCTALRQSNHLWYEFSTLAELRELVLKLPERDDAWAGMFKEERRTTLIAAAVIVVLLITSTMVMLRRSEGLKKTVEAVKADTQNTSQIKDNVIEMAGQVSAIHTQMEELKKALISQNGDPEAALKSVAAQYGLSPEQLRSGIETFVANYDKTPHPPPDQKELRNIAGKFVMRGNTPSEFAHYVDGLQFTSWKPSFIVLHSTESPLQAWKKSPEGWLNSFLNSFVKNNGWNGGPHLFVDETKIWVFNALNMPGVHARQWNKESIGVEMVGEYDSEPLLPAVRDTTVSALATLCRKLGLPATAIRFHGELPDSYKTCPGKNVDKADLIQRVAAVMGGASNVNSVKATTPVANSAVTQAVALAPTPPPVYDKVHAEILGKVVRIIVEQLGVNPAQVIPTARLIEDLGADSLDLVELIMAVEEEFALKEIPDEDAVKVKTVGDLVNLIARLQKAGVSKGK